MPAVGETLQVKGLAELQRAFKVADKTLARELRQTLREVAEPVRGDAETLAVSAIPRVTLPWSQMRVGVTQSAVYVAPRKRGTRDGRLRRPTFAGLLLERAMVPALARNETRVMVGMDRMLQSVGSAWERV